MMVATYASVERTPSRQQSTCRTVARSRRNARNPAARPSQVPLSSTIQLKLTTGATDDPLEHEADRVADHVMRMPDAEVSIAAAPRRVSRTCTSCQENPEHKCESCEEETKLRMKPAEAGGTAPDEAPPVVEDVLRQPGQALNAATRTFFEQRFGHDFSGVRIHIDQNSAESARAVGAQAYTVGSHIAFAASSFAGAGSTTSPQRATVAR